MLSRSQQARDELIDEAIRCFRSINMQDKPPAELSQAVLVDLKEADAQTPSQAVCQPLLTRAGRTRGRDADRSSAQRAGLFASVAVIMLVCLGFWPSVSGNVGLADAVVDAVSQVKSVTYEIVETVDGEPDKSTRVMVSGSERIRAEFPNGDVLIVDTSKERQIRLMPKEKRAIVRSAFPSDAVSSVASARLSPLQSLRKVRDFATKELPSRVIGGKELIGFVCDEGPYANLKVWVDPETKLPVRMESSTKDAVGKMLQEVIRNFVYDSSLHSSLFVVSVPVGYEADVKLVSSSKPREFQIVPGEGVGPLQFGMTEAEVVGILGNPRDKGSAPIGQLLDYGTQGLRLEISREQGLRAIHCISQAAYGFSVRSFSGKTDKGIGIGASPQQVKAAYGEPIQEHNNRSIGLMLYARPAATFKYREGKLAEVILVKPSVER